MKPDQSSDCVVIDADDHDVPMYVQHTEAMLVEIDRMVLNSVNVEVIVVVP